MKVRFLESISGLACVDTGLPEHSFSASEVADIPDAKATAWIKTGICAPIKSSSRNTAQSSLLPETPEAA
jgi:hypothetical protein